MIDEKLNYITVQKINDRWMLIDPYGAPFISKAVCYVSCNGEPEINTKINYYKTAIEKEFQSKEEWADDTAHKLRSLGFNTIGPWSTEQLFKDKMYYIAIINLARDDWQTGTVDDYFSSGFYEHADQTVREEIRKNDYLQDKFLIGYCTGGEMRWGSDWRSDKSVVFDYLNFPGDKEGKFALIKFFRELYQEDLHKFNKHWLQNFQDWAEAQHFQQYKKASKAAKPYEEEALYFIAKQYFKTAHEIMRKHDPNHLILGTRFISISMPRGVIRACRDYVDVVSINHYELLFGMHKYSPLLTGTTKTSNFLKEFYELTQKPILITEFGFRLKAEGRRTLPMGFPTIFSDKKRGMRAYRYIKEAINSKHIVGYHLFQWFDQPPKGRFDYQNSRFGLVNLENKLYEDYAGYLKEANALSPS